MAAISLRCSPAVRAATFSKPQRNQPDTEIETLGVFLCKQMDHCIPEKAVAQRGGCVLFLYHVVYNIKELLTTISEDERFV